MRDSSHGRALVQHLLHVTGVNVVAATAHDPDVARLIAPGKVADAEPAVVGSSDENPVGIRSRKPEPNGIFVVIVMA